MERKLVWSVLLAAAVIAGAAAFIVLWRGGAEPPSAGPPSIGPPLPASVSGGAAEPAHPPQAASAFTAAGDSAVARADSTAGAEGSIQEPGAEPSAAPEPGQRAWGAVRDLAGRSASDMVLEWTRSQHALKPREAVTDGSGRYEVAGLEAGPYFVRIVPRLLRAAWDDAPRRRVTVRERTAGGGGSNRFDFTTDAGATLPVVVRAPPGAAAAGVEVKFRLTTLAPPAAARGISGFLPPTDARSRTELRGLPAAGKLVLEAAIGASGTARLELDLETLPPEAHLDAEAPRS